MKTSIVILTRNQLDLTKDCLDSIRRNTPEDYEIIIIDNGSSDDTIAYLRQQNDIILHENNENLGFAKGCNQGFDRATGDSILFLNNDTVVTKNWLTTMLRTLHSSHDIGMVGPVTNYASGHHKIPAAYSSIPELEAFAEEQANKNPGVTVEVRRLVGFCLLVKRSVLEEIGCFDERYGLGNYEDDDLSLRAIRAGYRLMVVHDSFIHHIGHATMKHLEEDSLQSLLQENNQKAIEKWGDEIHTLLYRPVKQISLCMVVPPELTVQTLHASILSIRNFVDEMIIIDSTASDETLDLNTAYPPIIYKFDGDISELDSAGYRFAFDIATKDYVLWLQGDEILTKEEQRQLAGLKLSIPDETEITSIEFGGKLRYLTRRDRGFVPPRDIVYE